MKRLILLSLAIVVLILLAKVGLQFVPDPVDHPAVVTSDVSEQIARGAYLARVGDCMACHTARGGKQYAGGRTIDTDYGRFVSPNITPDPATGLGLWTGADFWRALHDGRSRDGKFLYPVFPFPNYSKVTREDSDALFAYLKTLAPIEQPAQPHQLRFPYSQRNLLAVWRALYFKPGIYQADQKQSAEWNRGAYLVQGLGHCSACHTPRTALGASEHNADLAGGLIPLQNWYAPALTADPEAGLGSWDRQQIADLLKTGSSTKGAVFGPMAEVVAQSLQHVSDSDINAMAAYLKSLPQTGAAAPAAALNPSEEFDRSMKLGEKVYEKNCADCHQANGQGSVGAYPPLAGNHTLTMPNAVNPIRIVLNGGYPPSTFGNPRPFGMPPFANVLSDAEVVGVVNYMRNSWGNHAGPVGPGEINRDRGIPAD